MSSYDIDSFLENTQAPMVWQQPEQFKLDSEAAVNELGERIASGVVTSVIDPVEAIADDLYELHNPAIKADDAARAAFVSDVLAQGKAFGTWHHMPWSGALVRFPDVADHRALRTSRNRNLITAPEQAVLYASKMAIFGLSVGSNIVERLVLSGIGGSIAMGDFDRLSPSNLNRINGVFSDVGAGKIDLMARKISEVDPYIEQTHFHQGFNASIVPELSSFAPSVIFDEVDQMQAKAQMRAFAMEQGVPLIMATDLGDRSLIDVERHDLGTAKPFHGKVKKELFDRMVSGDISDDERKKLTAKIVGLRHVTTRMLESLMEVEKTIPGLPQLGTTASMGGSLAAVAAREIVLGHELPSGRYVSSPKTVLKLKPQASAPAMAKTARSFIKSSKS
ncbi:MAG: UBA/THIF-type binding protein [Candidatus Saccharibacteria bacterium]|nr:UBA/THIF-type binding protein [Candidatus Saccharibacteria bacterium]